MYVGHVLYGVRKLIRRGIRTASTTPGRAIFDVNPLLLRRERKVNSLLLGSDQRIGIDSFLLSPSIAR
jgi:hypothetical protein